MTGPTKAASAQEFPLDLSSATVVIPAAGRVPEGILSLASISTPAMIPVAGRPVIHWTLDYLTGRGAKRFVIAVPSRGLAVEDHAECVFGSVASFDWLVPSSDRGVGFTVLEALGGIDGPALVVLGDTLFDFNGGALPLDRPWLLTGEVHDSERWCIVRTDAMGAVTSWHNKRAGLEPPLVAAAGIYWFPDAPTLYQRAATELQGVDRIEMSMLMQLAAGDGPVEARPAGSWRDCGNPDTQELSRRQVLAERSFNSLTFDDLGGTVRKSSDNREKLIDEINYIRLLPTELSALFPRLVDASTDWEDPWLELEYYGYPTLTELLLFENLGLWTWETIFGRIEGILERFRAHRRPVAAGALRQMYVNKTFERLGAVRAEPHMRSLTDPDELVINGVRHRNLDRLLDDATAAIEAGSGDALGCVIHGDLCFSNILFDLRTGVCRLIDPRGSFGRAGIHGDQRYDVAKLHHSVIGGYDHLVAGLYRLSDDLTGKIELDIHITRNQRQVQEVYEDRILSRWKTPEIELITGLMLASLPPLHEESAERQRALYVRGVELVSSSLEAGA